MVKKLSIQTKRIYEEPAPEDGYRILVDRLWPRGVKKDEAQLDEWNKELAPSTTLRKWFHQDLQRFDDFSLHYQEELLQCKDELHRVRKIGESRALTLLYAAKDSSKNHATVLCDVIKALK